MSTQAHPCAGLPLLPLALPEGLPATVDAFIDKALGGTADQVRGRIMDSALFRVEVDLRDLAALAGPAWRAIFIEITQAKLKRVQDGHAH